jgi:hypothetical protein
MVVSIDLFLRQCESSSITDESFNQNRFIMGGEYVVDAFSLVIHGKSKKRKRKDGNYEVSNKRTRLMWTELECPEFDAVRHLIGFLYCLGWQGGHIFPSRHEIRRPPEDGIYKTSISEQELLDELKKVFNTELGVEDKITAHSPRKTGYLFAALKKVLFKDVKRAADHESAQVVERYERDAYAIAATLEVQHDPRNKLGKKWNDCYSEPDHIGVRAVEASVRYQRPVAEIVRGFVEELCGLSPNDPRARHPNVILSAVMNFRRPENPYVTLDNALEPVGKNLQTTIKHCVGLIESQAATRAVATAERQLERKVAELTRQRMEKVEAYLQSQGIDTDRLAIPQFLNDLAADSRQDLHPFNNDSNNNHAVEETTPKPARVEKRKGTKTLPRIHDIGRKSAEEKLAWVAEHCGGVAGEYVAGDRTFLLRWNPIRKCFLECCGKDVQRFLALHGNGKGNFSAQDLTKAPKMKGCQRCCAN